MYLGKVVGGRYRIDSLIEETGFAGLYRGANTVVDREVTVKIVSPRLADFKIAIFDEARKISRINHPNVLSVTDLGKDVDATIYVIYENFFGESLKTAMSRDGQFDVERAVRIIRQIAGALDVVYPSLQVYGSLKTENILLASDDANTETVKVLNFFDCAVFNRSNQDAILLPDIEYANSSAPELIAGDLADERSDVYSLGSLLFQMLAGEAPFPAESMADAVTKICNDPPPPMSSFRSDLPGNLEQIILTAMAKNPEMRYQTVAEFSNELERFAGSSTLAVVAAVSEKPKHDIWKTGFVVFAGISLLTVALIYATSVKQTNPATQLLPDANGQPVQPIGPATGTQEQNLANMQGMSAETVSNSVTAIPPGTLPGGDGYDPWKNGVQPPPGTPRSGQTVNIDPNNPSVFMPPEGCIPQPSGILLCPAPANKAAKPTPTPIPKPNAANTNVSAAPTPKASPTPEKPAAKPTPTPKPAQTGKPKNGDDL